jgi:hypothetical protein
VRKLLIVVLLVGTVGCAKPPVGLSPDAAIAFQASRVVKALDVVRDAAIAAHDMTPPKLTTNDTREVVQWHKTVVQVIQVTPAGWKPVVKTSLYVATCDARLAPVPAPSCVPQLPKAALAQLQPYMGVVVLVLLEVM